MEGGVVDVLVDAELDRVYVQCGSGGLRGVVHQQDVLPPAAPAVLVPVLDLTPAAAVGLVAADDAEERGRVVTASACSKIHSSIVYLGQRCG